MESLTADVVAEFWARVEKSDGCWTWARTRDREGYGRFKFAGKYAFAHRVAWTIVNGKIPQGMAVMHKCDNPPCVNPAHLMIGTWADNNRDRMLKGRNGNSGAPPGERNGRAVLTEDKVRFIRKLYSSPGKGPSHADVAKRFGVSKQAIDAVVSGKSWSHVR